MVEKYMVMGAGHAGKAMAAQPDLRSAEVTRWNRTFELISITKQRGGIGLESTKGRSHGFGKLSLVTSDIEKAATHAQISMVVLPSSPHADTIKAVARYLKDGQVVILRSGRTLGTLEFSKMIRDYGYSADIAVGEAKWIANDLTRCVQEGLVT